MKNLKMRFVLAVSGLLMCSSILSAESIAAEKCNRASFPLQARLKMSDDYPRWAEVLRQKAASGCAQMNQKTDALSIDKSKSLTIQWIDARLSYKAECVEQQVVGFSLNDDFLSVADYLKASQGFTGKTLSRRVLDAARMKCGFEVPATKIRYLARKSALDFKIKVNCDCN